MKLKDKNPFSENFIIGASKKSALLMFDKEENFEVVYKALLDEKVNIKVDFKDRYIEIFI